MQLMGLSSCFIEKYLSRPSPEIPDEYLEIGWGDAVWGPELICA